MIEKRASGILLHITSLPSRFGIGDIGPGACRFAEILKRACQSYWQILPLNPPARGSYSPYYVMSSFAGNVCLISPELLCRDGLLTRDELKDIPRFSARQVNYPAVVACKRRLLARAYQRFAGRAQQSSYEQFCRANAYWLEDFAAFSALRQHFGSQSWLDWPKSVRDRDKDELKAMSFKLRDRIDRQKFLQFVFFQQWQALREHCRQLGIRLIGDIPIYVSHDSADVWANPEIFKLSASKKPRVVAGVPPDDFSRTGQLWGNPVYDWASLRKRGYGWWVRRLKHSFGLYDIVRLDHFCGFVSYCEVPAGDGTAARGRWVPGPGAHFFGAIGRRLGPLPVMAEDLGIVTPAVKQLISQLGIPGTKVLLFAFGDSGGTSPYLPHNFVRNCVVYTGTHDTNTVRGWFEGQAGRAEKHRLLNYLGRSVSPPQVHWALIQLAMASVAELAITPLQDVLGLGAQARMNRPGTTRGNWKWRFMWEQLKPAVVNRLARLTNTYGRV
jgi:4-alpha-glucanotransferase